MIYSWTNDHADIPLPEDVQAPGEEGDEDEDAHKKASEPEKWKELGLNTVR